MPARHLSNVLLPLPLRPDDPEELARSHREVDVLQGAELFVARASQRMQRTLLQRVAALLGDLEATCRRPARQSAGALFGVWSVGTESQGIGSGRPPGTGGAQRRGPSRLRIGRARARTAAINTATAREERTAERRARGEREQRSLDAVRQRSVGPDQRQPRADLGVELVVHPLRVFALADQLADFGVVLHAQPRFALDQIAARASPPRAPARAPPRGRSRPSRRRPRPRSGCAHERRARRCGARARRRRSAAHAPPRRSPRRPRERSSRCRPAPPRRAKPAGANTHGTPLSADSKGTSPKPSYTDG